MGDARAELDDCTNASEGERGREKKEKESRLANRQTGRCAMDGRTDEWVEALIGLVI